MQKKHLNDVIKLAAALSGEERVSLTGEPKVDFDAFIPVLEALDHHSIEQVLKGAGIGALSKDDVIEILHQVYGNGGLNV